MMSTSKEKYLQAVERLFKGWQALAIAVENSFGGPDSVEKAEWMIEVTGGFVWDSWPVSVEEVEDYLGTIMDQEFDTILDDGSLPQVSKQLCDLRQLCMGSSPKAIEEYLSKLPVLSPTPAHSEGNCVRPNAESASNCTRPNAGSASNCTRSNAGSASNCTRSNAGSASNYMRQLQGLRIESGSEDDDVAEEVCKQEDNVGVKDDGWTVVSKGKRK